MARPVILLSGFSWALFSNGPVCFVSKTHLLSQKESLFACECLTLQQRLAFASVAFSCRETPWVFTLLAVSHLVWKAVCKSVTSEPWLLRQKGFLCEGRIIHRDLIGLQDFEC